MPIKMEEVQIPEGRKITAMQLSFMADFRLAQVLKEKMNESTPLCSKCRQPVDRSRLEMMDVLKECLSKDDYEYLEELTMEEVGLVMAAINRVNGWAKIERDFPQAGKQEKAQSSDSKLISSSSSDGIASMQSP